MTQRLESEDTWVYFKIKDVETDQIVAPSKLVKWREVDHNFFDEKLFELAKKKTKQMIGAVSHCKANSNRDTLILNIKKHMQFDLYGKCGSLM